MTQLKVAFSVSLRIRPWRGVMKRAGVAFLFPWIFLGVGGEGWATLQVSVLTCSTTLSPSSLIKLT